MLKNKIRAIDPILLPILSIMALLYAGYIAIRFSGQVPLDLYSFRQTQTAITAYWLMVNGFSFDYETPVVGMPWSIPFEFPLYQYIVAVIAKVLGLSLDVVGRLVSFTFLALTIIPARSIIKSLNLSNSIFYIFVALLFSSPIYLYWGRSFMIETTALFFAVVSIKYFIDIMKSKNIVSSSFLFLVFITLSILQKSTTGLPVIAVLALVYLLLNLRERTSPLSELFLGKKAFLAVVYFGVPLVIGVAWVVYSDQVKMLNEVGQALTSKSLSTWNWGTIEQRFSDVFYENLIWTRLFEKNLSGALGLALLMTSIFVAKREVKSIILVSLVLGLLPLYLFTNLHIVHGYYQSANILFLLFAISVSLGSIIEEYFDNVKLLFMLTAIMVTSNYLIFTTHYLPTVETEYNEYNSRDYAVASILKKELAEGESFVSFGNSWSSSFGYLSERKSFNVPLFYKHYQEIASHPEKFIEEGKLGGVVSCTGDDADTETSIPKDKNVKVAIAPPSINYLSLWASKDRSWKIANIKGCYLTVPKAKPNYMPTRVEQAKCQGGLDTALQKKVNGQNILSVTGWTTISGESGIVPEQVYITLNKENESPVYYEAIHFDREDINVHFGHSNPSSGYTVLVNTSNYLLEGEYKVGIARENEGVLEVCPFTKDIVISE